MNGNPYANLARVYEVAGWGQFSESMVETVLTLSRQRGLAPGAHVVDLACGVGIACVRFSQAGFRVTGIDRSEEMLAQARRKGLEAGVRVKWTRGDMRAWQLDEPSALITCMYDSMNYMLTANDLGAVLGCVGRSLENAGHFIFDMNTIRGLAEMWGTKATVNYADEELFIVSDPKWDYESNLARLVFHGFSRRDDGTWIRWTETHVERGYAVEEIRQQLNDAGLETVQVLDAQVQGNPPANANTMRVLVIAQKRGSFEDDYKVDIR